MNPSNKLTTEQFISKAKSIHGDKFDSQRPNMSIVKQKFA